LLADHVRHVGFALASLSLLCVDVDASGHGQTIWLSQPDRPRCSGQVVVLGSLIVSAPGASGFVSLIV
jgi:hypothetical protein